MLPIEILEDRRMLSIDISTWLPTGSSPVLTPTPVVALNRAVAVAEVYGPRAALALLTALERDLERYHLYHAVRGDLLARSGARAEAAAAYDAAIALATNACERAALGRRRVAAG